MTQNAVSLRIWRSAEGEYVIATSAAEAIALYAREGGYDSVAAWCDESHETEEDWAPLDDDSVFPFTTELEEPTDVEHLELRPGETLRRSGEKPTGAAVEYIAQTDGKVYLVTRRKRAAVWCAEFGEPSYFASKNC